MRNLDHEAIEAAVIALTGRGGCTDQKLKDSTALYELAIVSLESDVMPEVRPQLLRQIFTEVFDQSRDRRILATRDYFGWGWTQRSYQDVLAAAQEVAAAGLTKKSKSMSNDAHMQLLLENRGVRQELVGITLGMVGRQVRSEEKRKIGVLAAFTSALIEFCKDANKVNGIYSKLIDGNSNKNLPSATEDVNLETAAPRAESANHDHRQTIDQADEDPAKPQPETILELEFANRIEQLARTIQAQLNDERSSELPTRELINVQYSSTKIPALMPPDVNNATGEYIPPLHREGAVSKIAIELASTQCLIILGGEGSGKTIAVRELALQILRSRTSPTDPVPIIFRLSSWNPYLLTLDQWMVRELVSGFTSSNSAERHQTDENLASRLVRAGLILPILDGLDELISVHRRKAIARINASLGFIRRIVLTSRMEQYKDSVESNHLVGHSAVVELGSLDFNEIRRYLRSSGPRDMHRDGKSIWDPLLDRLQDGTTPRARIVLDALANPLMISLVRDSYRNAADVPTELLDDVERFPDHEAIQNHLMDRFVDVICGDRFDPEDAGSQKSVKKAKRQLGFIAACLTARRTKDVVWWEFGSSSELNPLVVWFSAAFAIACVPFIGLSVFLFPSDYMVISVISAICCFTVALLLGLEASEPRVLSWDHGAATVKEYLSSKGPFGNRTTYYQRRGWIVLAIMILSAAFSSAWGVLAGIIYAAVSVSAGLAFARPIFRDFRLQEKVWNPKSVLRADFQASLFRSFLLGSSAFVFIAGADFGQKSLAIGAAAFLIIFISSFIVSSSGAWLIFHLSHNLRHTLPVRRMKFLEAAHSAGVLRQSGPKYQFRHSLLQTRLAINFIESHPKGNFVRLIAYEAARALEPLAPLEEQLESARKEREQAKGRANIARAEISIMRILVEMEDIVEATRLAQSLVRYLPSKGINFISLSAEITVAYEMLAELLIQQGQLADAIDTYQALLGICKEYESKVLHDRIFMDHDSPELKAKMKELEEHIAKLRLRVT